MKWKIFALTLCMLVFASGVLASDPMEKPEKASAASMDFQAQSTLLGNVETYFNTYETYPTGLDDCGFLRIDNPFRTRFIQTNSELRENAFSLTKGANTDLEKTFLLYDFVSNIKYKRYEDWRYPADVLDTLDGDCNDQAVLLASMLNSIGIHSYVAYGGETLTGEDHAWVAVSIEGKLLQVDPTATDFYSVYENSENYSPILGIYNQDLSMNC